MLSAQPCCAQARAGEVDFIAGVDLRYHDIAFNRIYDILVNVTPGVRWQIAPGLDLSGQLFVPVVNQFGDEWKRVRLNVGALSYQRRLGSRFAAKLSAGQFSNDRYGLDFKAMYWPCRWFAFEGQVGLTGYARIEAFRWQVSPMGRISGTLGGSIYIPGTGVQMRGRAGYYLRGDIGLEAEAMRHFQHTTIGLKARWSDKQVDKFAFGFNITVMLPPYTRTRSKVNFRPASAFALSYTNRSNYGAVNRYETDPEENVRQGWFTPDVAPWGLNAERPDFPTVDKAGNKADKGSINTASQTVNKVSDNSADKSSDKASGLSSDSTKVQPSVLTPNHRQP